MAQKGVVVAQVKHRILRGLHEGKTCIIQEEYAGFADVILANDEDTWVFPQYATVKKSDLKRIQPYEGKEDALL